MVMRAIRFEAFGQCSLIAAISGSERLVLSGDLYRRVEEVIGTAAFDVLLA
jgi:hypothetical protein